MRLNLGKGNELDCVGWGVKLY